jgi:hypothetical protein
MGSYVEGNGALIFRSRMSPILALLVALIGAACAALGVFDRDLYGALVRAGALGERTAIASVAQDLVLLPVSVLLLATTALFLARKGVKLLILNLGIVWCEFYAFGLYAIQGQYTSIYVLYLAAVSLSIFSMMLGAAALGAIDQGAMSLPGVVGSSWRPSCSSSSRCS